MSRPNSLLAALNRHWLMRGTATGAAVSGAVLPLPPVQYSGVLPSALRPRPHDESFHQVLCERAACAALVALCSH